MTPEAQALAEEIKRLAGFYANGNRKTDWLALDAAIDRLAAMAQPVVPQGWQLVPVEPTREMINAYVNVSSRFFSARSDWAAMLAAAPTPAQGKGEQG